MFSWFELLLLIGVVQGVVTSVLLLIKPNRYLSDQLLALLLLAFSTVCVKTVIYTLDLPSTYWWLQYIPISFETALPPLAYLYCKALTANPSRLTKHAFWHFIPFILMQLYALVFYSCAVAVKMEAIEQSWLTSFHLEMVKLIEDYATVLLIFGYLLASVLRLKLLYKQANNLTADNENQLFSWLRTLFVMMSVLLLFLVINMIISTVGVNAFANNIHWQLYFVYMAGVIYYIGHKGLQLPAQTAALISSEKPVTIARNLNPEQLHDIASRIRSALEVGVLYRDPKMTINVLAEHLSIDARTLSFVINQVFNMPFRDLINSYRIDEVKTKLIGNPNGQTSVLALALDSGFNSEATFYRLFKKHTGLTPTQYLEQNNSALFSK